MTVEAFKELVRTVGRVEGGSEAHEVMHRVAQEALRLTMELNSRYHTPAEVRALMARLTSAEIDESFGLFPPFYTDFGRNMTFGRGVFINAGCKFQDQGGIRIGDGALIGHNAVLATINHDFRPDRRADMTFRPIHIGRDAWLGANVTITQGVTVGDGAVIAAGAVVTRDVPPRTIVGGIPARVIREIK